jgi:uncharacterized protein with beta-barrel porin domain
MGRVSWLRRRRTSSAHPFFSNAGTFKEHLDNPRLAKRLGAGVQLQASDRWDVGLEYNAHVASHIVANSGVLRMNYHF